MLIGKKLREIREARNLSQGDIERRTGLLRCYTSRVENGHTIPSVETLEKYARALEIPLYRLFCDGDGPVKKPDLGSAGGEKALSKKHRRELRQFASSLAGMSERHRKLLFVMAQHLASHR